MAPTPIPGRRLFRFPWRSRRQLADDIDRELAFHLAALTDELRAAGMPDDEARAEARRRFGDVERARRLMRSVDTRAERRSRWRDRLADLRLDLRYGLRQLRRSPGFTTVTVLTLALGIGATTAIFAAVDKVLLEPLPYREPDRIMTLWQNDVASGVTEDFLSPANFLDLRERAISFSHLAALQHYSLDLMGEEGPIVIDSWQVSEDFFPMLGAAPLLGRVPVAEEFTPGRENVVVLQYDAWRERFGGDSALIGRTMTLDEEPYTIIGVMPPEFGVAIGRDMYHPMVMTERERQLRGATYLVTMARLAPAATVAQAEAEVARIAAQLVAEHPRVNRAMTMSVIPLRERVVREARPALLILFGAVGCLLLIACANVANLLLARALGREREFAIRAALGAGRGRVVRQLLAETALLALLGAAGGVLLAHWGVQALRAAGPETLLRLEALAIDGRVLGFTIALTVATALAIGLIPALRLLGPDVHEGMRQGGRTASFGRRRMSGGLVIAEVALAMVLLVGAGLLVRSLVSLLQVERGYRTDRVFSLTAQTWSKYQTPQQRILFAREAIDALAALPGVTTAGMTSSLPLAPAIGAYSASVRIEGRASGPGSDDEILVHAAAVAGDYFGALSIPLLRGRLFETADDSSGRPVMLINESMAARFWPGEDPIGKQAIVRFVGPPGPREVVGIVGDVRHERLDEAPRPGLFLPHAQAGTGAMAFTVRTAGEPRPLLRAATAAIHRINPLLAIKETGTLEELLADTLRERRFNLMLFTAFAAAALLLAIVGIYGVMSHATGARTREIGVRMALGAHARAVVLQIMRRGTALAGAGIAIGLLVAAALTRYMRGLLFGVDPVDAVTYAALAAVLLLAAVAACYLPARRAAQVDPTVALRAE